MNAISPIEISKAHQFSPDPKAATAAITASAQKFVRAAKRADPTVTGMMLYTDILDHPGAIMGVLLERNGTIVRKNPIFAEVTAAATEVIDAIEAETRFYRNSDPYDDDGAVQFIERVSDAKTRLLNIEGGRVAPEYVQALALLKRRWLIMEGCYAKRDDAEDCEMVDALLAGTRFDGIDMLWHLNGVPRDKRPTDAELQANWQVAA